jgi:hypothetical protein
MTETSDTPRTDRNYIRGFEALSSHTLDEDEWVRADFARQLERELAEARKDAELWANKVAGYDQLIMAVARKYPGESRFQTALRYIEEREKPSNTIAQANAIASDPPER